MSVDNGNGENGGAAIYILSEIGQEKQLDVNHEAFMGYEEPLPLTSSASLSLVRLMIKGMYFLSFGNPRIIIQLYKRHYECRLIMIAVL